MAGGVLLDADIDIDQAGGPARHLNRARVRHARTGEHAQQARLARPVPRRSGPTGRRAQVRNDTPSSALYPVIRAERLRTKFGSAALASPLKPRIGKSPQD
jgi:hypothetical protein